MVGASIEGRNAVSLVAVVSVGLGREGLVGLFLEVVPVEET